MEHELIVSKDEIMKMFSSGVLEDNKNGWLFNKRKVQIIAIHESETKYIANVANAEFYKLIPIKK